MQRNTLTLEQAMARAFEHLKAGRLLESEQLYRAVLNTQPDNALANHNLGLIAHRVGRSDMAIGLFIKAVSKNSSIPAFYVNLGAAYSAVGKYEDAVAAYGKAISLNPDDGYLFSNLGYAFLSLNKPTEAEVALKRAIGLQPENFEARIAIAQIFTSRGNYAEAIEHLDYAGNYSHVPGFPVSKLGKTYARALHIGKAKKYLEEALLRDPVDSDGSSLVLATLNRSNPPDRAPDAYMKKLYAERANNWDQGIASENSYRGMLLVENELRRLVTKKIAILDAGCGTGQVGIRVSDLATTLDGVDISPHMLAKAQEKSVFQSLIAGDMIAYMRSKPKHYDAIISAATIIHFGDLTDIFQNAALSLRSSGLFIFTAFPCENPDTYSIASERSLAEGGCYSHGRNYLANMARDHGFSVEKLEREIHEYKDNEPVFGLIMSLRLGD